MSHPICLVSHLHIKATFTYTILINYTTAYCTGLQALGHRPLLVRGQFRNRATQQEGKGRGASEASPVFKATSQGCVLEPEPRPQADSRIRYSQESEPCCELRVPGSEAAHSSWESNAGWSEAELSWWRSCWGGHRSEVHKKGVPGSQFVRKVIPMKHNKMMCVCKCHVGFTSSTDFSFGSLSLIWLHMSWRTIFQTNFRDTSSKEIVPGFSEPEFS